MTKENSSSLVVISIPDKYQIYDDCLNNLRTKWIELQNSKKYDINAPLEHLNGIFKKLDISFIDLTPFIKKKSLSMGKLYLEKDIHWNYLGNKAVAEILSEQLIPFLN